MALSDREQQLLDEIESALTEDVEFTESVRKAHGAPNDRTALRSWAIIAVGVVLLFAGFFVKVAGFPLLSLVGFGVIFGGGLMLIRHSDQRYGHASRRTSARSAKKRRASSSHKLGKSSTSGNGLADRFQQRFEDPNR